MAVIKAGVLGGIILFIWGAISWMVLPWHQPTIHQFKNEKAVSEVIQANASRSGVYLFPSMFNKQETAQNGPMIFASVNLKGSMSMVIPLLLSLLIQIIAACLVAWMVFQTTFGYLCRVWFVVVFGIAAGMISQLPNWNWFGFEINFVGVMLADLIIGWFLAGLVIAAFRKNPKMSV